MLFSVALGVKSWKRRVRHQFQFKLGDVFVFFPSGNLSAKQRQLRIPEETSQVECSGCWFGFGL